MERISGISNTSRSNNNSRGNSYYNNRKYGKASVDSLEYKKVLDTAIEARRVAKNRDDNKFKSLIEKAGEKLTSQLEAAPLKNNEYNRELTMMMTNSGLAARSRVERKPIEELSTTTNKKRTISSYTTSYEQYRRDLSYVNPLYKSFEDTSKDSRGYKSNYSNNKKAKKDIGFDGIENNTSLIKPTEKISFWSKFKNKIKNFFKTEEKKQENVSAVSVQPKVDKAAQYRESVQKSVPQIDIRDVDRRKDKVIRELAIKSR